MSFERALQYFKDGKYKQAEKIAQKFPNNKIFVHMIGVIRSIEGKFDKALAQYKKALKLDPDFVDSHQAILEITDDQQSANYLIDRVKKGEFQTLKGAISAIFTLGHWCDRIQDYESAWLWWKQGNELKQYIQPKWSVDPLRNNLEQSKKLIQEHPQILDNLRKLKTQSNSNSGDKLGFIVGVPRSGTTLIEQTLAAHSQIKSGGEVIEFHPTVGKYANNALNPISLLRLSPEEVSLMTETYLRGLHKKVRKSKKTKYYLDKTPTIWTLINYVQLLFPESKTVLVNRNPLDVAVSCYSMAWIENHGWATSFDTLADFYKLYLDIQEYINVYLDIPHYKVNYEDFVQSPYKETQNLVESVFGLQYEEGCNTKYNKNPYVRTSSLYQVRKPIYSKSIGRWENYKEHLKPLMEEFTKRDIKF